MHVEVSFYFGSERWGKKKSEEMFYSETGSIESLAGKSSTCFSPEDRKELAQPTASEGGTANLLPFRFSAELGKPEFFLIIFLK